MEVEADLNKFNGTVNNVEVIEGGPEGVRGDELPAQPELVVTGTVESLEKGLSEGELALIRVAGEKANKEGKQLIIRYRLKETEAELREKYGGEKADKMVAQQAIYEKLKKIIPERASIGTVLGAKMNK